MTSLTTAAPAGSLLCDLLTDHVDLAAIDVEPLLPGLVALRRASHPPTVVPDATVLSPVGMAGGSLQVSGWDAGVTWTASFSSDTPLDVIGAAIDAWVLR